MYDGSNETLQKQRRIYCRPRELCETKAWYLYRLDGLVARRLFGGRHFSTSMARQLALPTWGEALFLDSFA